MLIQPKSVIRDKKDSKVSEMISSHIAPIWAFTLISDNKTFQKLAAKIVKAKRVKKELETRDYSAKHIDSFTRFVAFADDYDEATKDIPLAQEPEFYNLVDLERDAQKLADQLHDDGHKKSLIRHAAQHVQRHIT
jgi:hypothetical protein